MRILPLVLVVLLLAWGTGTAAQISFSGRVVDADGEAVSATAVAVYTIAFSEDMSFAVSLSGQSETDDDGAFAVAVEAHDEPRRQMIVLARKARRAIGWSNARDKTGITIDLAEPATLAGLVVDERGAPVPGADVAAMLMAGADNDLRWIIGWGELSDLQTKTDAGGRFSFENIPPTAKAEFIVSAPGKAAHYTGTMGGPPAMQFKPGRTDIRIALAPEAKIEGAVVEHQSGKPLAGVHVVAQPKAEPNPFAVRTATSSPDGAFIIDGLKGGEVIVRIADSDENWTCAPTTVTTEPDGTVGNIRLEAMAPVFLEVVVTDAEDKTPVDSVYVGVKEIASNQHKAGRTGQDGVARIRVGPGDYQLTSSRKQGYISQSTSSTVTVKKGSANRIEIALKPPPSLSGVVIDPEGKPVEGALVKVLPAGRNSVRTDAQGEFKAHYDMRAWGAPEATPQLYLLVRHPERNLAMAAEIDEQEQDVEIKLTSGALVRGKVVNPEGKPLPGTTCSVMMRADRWGARILDQPVTADAQGAYRISAIPRERDYTITASADGYGRNEIEAVVPHEGDETIEAEDIVLSIADLSISGVVVDVDDKPVANAHISTRGNGQQFRNAQTDAEGKFTADGLCKGSVNVHASLNREGRYLSGNAECDAGDQDVRITIGENVGSQGRPAEKQPTPLLGKTLPTPADVGIMTELAGKPVLVCFWSAEERPSRRCLRMLAQHLANIGDEGVVAVAVHAFPMDDKALAEWKERFKITFEMVALPENAKEVRLAWGVQSLPWLILTDAQHVVRAEGFRIEEFDEKLALVSQ